MPQPDVSEVRNPFDVQGLEKYLSNFSNSSNLSGTTPGLSKKNIESPLTVKQFNFGQSNPTYLITDAKGFQFVLRRKPVANEKLVSKSAHAIEREFFILRAIHICNKATSKKVPVPDLYLLCEDESNIGYVFYLMEYVNGRQIKNPGMPGMSEPDAKLHRESIMETVLAIHSLDPTTLVKELPASHFPQFQPDKLAKSSGSYFERQIKTLSAVAKLQSKTVDPIPNFDKICKWLLNNAPNDPSKRTLIHGDFKIDNVLFHASEPRIVAVLDWELCTFGHPLFDLANYLQPFQLPIKLNQLLYNTDRSDMGLESQKSLATVYDQLPIYESKLGYKWDESDPSNNPVDNWNAGYVFGLLRLCVISQGIAMRVAKGSASSGEADVYAKLYFLLSKLAVNAIEDKKLSSKL